MITNYPSFCYPIPIVENRTLECSLCADEVQGLPASVEQLFVKHEGPLGDKHPVHLKCLLEWVNYRALKDVACS